MLGQNPVFIPGPTNIPDQIRKACDMPVMDHRAAAFAEIIGPAREGVKKVMKTQTGEVILFNGSGTAGWEAAISNTLSPGDKVLAVRNGLFSARWVEMCERHGLDMTVIDAAWGEAIPVAKVAEVLADDRDQAFRAVLATYNETATGVTSDIAGIRGALDEVDHPALLLVDGVSAIASIDFRMDEWGVDVAVSGAQKGFMLHPGLAIIGVSPKAMAATKTATLPRGYFEFHDMMASYERGSYPYTPSAGLMNGLLASCDMLLDEGLDNVFARHKRIADGVRAAVTAWGLKLCAVDPASYSDTVTAIMVPDGFDSTALVQLAADRYNVAFGIGLGEVAGKVFRIGHLGHMSDVQALAGIATAEMCMADIGIPVALGAGVAAAQSHYRDTAAASLSAAAE